MPRRLFFQIYLTIIACLVMVVIFSGVFWNIYGRNHIERDVDEIIGRLVESSLPPATAPRREQMRAVWRLAETLELDITLFDAENRVVVATDRPRRYRPGFREENGFHLRRGGGSWSFTLDDQRLLVADFHKRGPRGRLLAFILYLGTIAFAVGLAAYPIVRRLTRRLEKLQAGVERIGTGDLAARVPVEGRDEVANLASSFNDAAAKIEKLVDGHRLLLANASHELRTPLSRIRLGIDMLKDGKPDPDRMAQLRGDIAELDALIDEILLMSRLDAGEEANITEAVDLLGLAAEECARYKECDLDGVNAEVPGDMRLIRRMLRNLLENAYKHGKPPVAVTIAVRDNHAILTVRDHGPGIKEPDRETVFRPFFRGAGNQNIKGYGLGLPLVRQIAEAHRGSVGIADTNFGTEIVVKLPLDGTRKV